MSITSRAKFKVGDIVRLRRRFPRFMSHHRGRGALAVVAEKSRGEVALFLLATQDLQAWYPIELLTLTGRHVTKAELEKLHKMPRRSFYPANKLDTAAMKEASEAVVAALMKGRRYV
jgi:hypothetical protein